MSPIVAGPCLLPLLLASCLNIISKTASPPASSSTRPPRLILERETATTFQGFDGLFGVYLDVENYDVINGTIYNGRFETSNGLKLSVHAALVPTAIHDRILIRINGGTGTDARYSLANFSHKAVVTISMRGLYRDEIKEHECELGEKLIDCLKTTPLLPQYNPLDNSKDIVDVMRIILGEMGEFTVDGAQKDHSFFGVNDRIFNVETGSYGATLLAYSLTLSDLPYPRKGLYRWSLRP